MDNNQFFDSDEKYRLIVELANEGIWAIDENMQTTFINDKMAQLFGYEKESMTGKKVRDFLFEEDIPVLEKRLSSRMEEPKRRYVQRFCHRDGHAVWCIVSATSLYDRDSRFFGSFAMLSDISGLKAKEKHIQEKEKELNSFLNALDEPAFLIDKQGQILTANKKTAQNFQMAAEEIKGCNIYDFLPSEIAKSRYGQV